MTPPPQPESQPPKERPSAFRRRLKRIVYNAAADALNSLFLILVLAAGRWLVEHIFGQSKFFDIMPVRYMFDAGDVAVIGRFIWTILKGEDKK